MWFKKAVAMCAGLIWALGVQAAPPIIATDSASGELDVIQIHDFDHDDAGLDYYLRSDDGGPARRLEFKGRPPADLLSGIKVRVRGQARGRVFEVEQIDAALDGTSGSGDGTAAAPATTTARTLVLMVDMLDAKASTRYTINQIVTQMYTGTQNVDGLYRASSYNQLALDGDANGNGQPDVFGPFTINYSVAGTNTCPYYDWAAAADAAATAAGVNLSLYRHRVYVLPRYNDLPGCNWAGLGNLGCGTYCRAWIAEAESGMVYAHELGHNFNMHHAGTDPNNDGVIDSEYGDYSGVMGSNRAWRQVNAPHKDQMGWFNAFPGSLTTVTGAGVFDIYPLESDPAAGTLGTQVLKIAKSTGDNYYLSLRKTIGSYGTSSTYADRVSVHSFRGGNNRTMLIKTLGVNESFTDSTNNLTVTVLGVFAGHATVQVSYGGTCSATAPTVVVSPSSQMGRGGDARTYNVAITNRDSNACSSSVFALTGILPPALSGLPSASSLTLAPGQTAEVAWTVRAATTATDGAFDVLAQVTAVAHAGGSDSGLFTVDATAPTTPAGLSASVSRKGAVNLSWTASFDGGSGVSHYRLLRDGVKIAEVSGTGFIDNAAVVGATHSYQLQAIDKVGNASGYSNALAVTVAGSTRGGAKPTR